DIGILVELAMTEKYDDTQPNMLEDFLNVMQQKFTDIAENGRPVKVNFSFDNNSELHMDILVGSNEDLLSQVVENWLMENSVHGVASSTGPTATGQIFDEVRIPLKSENGRN